MRRTILLLLLAFSVSSILLMADDNFVSQSSTASSMSQLNDGMRKTAQFFLTPTKKFDDPPGRVCILKPNWNLNHIKLKIFTQNVCVPTEPKIVVLLIIMST